MAEPATARGASALASPVLRTQVAGNYLRDARFTAVRLGCMAVALPLATVCCALGTRGLPSVRCRRQQRPAVQAAARSRRAARAATVG